METKVILLRRVTIWKTARPVVATLFLSIFLAVSFTQIAWAEPHYGGTLNLAYETDAMGFDAIKAKRSIGVGRGTAGLVMERLFKRDEAGKLVPILGLSAAASEDGKTWTIALRQAVRFHDGTPFNAEAVVKHWQRLLDPKNRYSQRLLLTPILKVEASGEFEVRFHLKHAWSAFTAVLTNPAGFTAWIPSPKAVEAGTHHRSPVGTGPFVFKEWVSGDRVVVEKNPNYWDAGKPYLDKVVLRPFLDHESRYAALVSGQADMMFTDRPAHVKKLADHPDFTDYVLNFRGAVILVLNTSKPPLDDVRVRRALAHAFDQKKYIAASFRNIVPFTEHWFGNALDCGDVGYRHPDLEKARALIAEYGKPVELEYVHSATKRGREAGVIVQQMFKQIGVKVNPVPSALPGIIKKLFTRNFDLSSWIIVGAADMGPISMATLHSKSPWNVSRYADKETDDLLVQQRMSTDPDVRARALCKIARKVNEDAPFLFLFGRQYHLFAKNHVKNIQPPKNGEEGGRFADLWIEK
jgi:peptide/nickel transport system substrate-binding protein